MADEAQAVPTWVYDARGGSRLVDLAPGSDPPRGWFLAPPSGVELAGDTSSPATPPTPLSMGERVDGLELRVMKLESQLAALTQPATAPVEPRPSEREALVARAKELKLEFHNRLGDDKLRALIAEAEAAAETPNPADDA